MAKNKRIIFVGKGGSGKTFVTDNLYKLLGITKTLTYTTRPIRDNEEIGVDYHFVSDVEFQTLIRENLLYEYDKFNNWYYGQTIKDFDISKILIKTPRGVDKLTESDRQESYVIYLNINTNVLRTRLLGRSDADSIERRLESDRKDFETFTNFDLEITNPLEPLDTFFEIVRIQLSTNCIHKNN